jgi:hypothetical protein
MTSVERRGLGATARCSGQSGGVVVVHAEPVKKKKNDFEDLWSHAHGIGRKKYRKESKLTKKSEYHQLLKIYVIIESCTIYKIFFSYA